MLFNILRVLRIEEDEQKFVWKFARLEWSHVANMT